MNHKKAFTLVELIVVITILAILATIWFLSFNGYQKTARDSTRMSDIWNMSKVIELARISTGKFPAVTNPIDVTFSGSVVWQQWSFGQESLQDAKRLSQVPVDPLTQSEYAYSTTSQTGEFQIGAILEWVSAYKLPSNQAVAATPSYDFSQAFIDGNYNGKFLVHSEQIDSNTDRVYVLWVPSILATNTESATIEDILTNNRLLYSGKKISPATYSWAIARDNDWSFTPTITSHGTSNSSIAVVYEGTSDELSTGSGKIDLVDSLRTYYASSWIQTEDSIEDFIAIDTNTDPNNAVALVNTYVSAWLWGMENTETRTTEVQASSWGGWGGWTPWPWTCNGMSATHLANLNNMGNADIVAGRLGVHADISNGLVVNHTTADWCSVRTLDIAYGDAIDMIDELWLLYDLTHIWAPNTSPSWVPPETLANLENLTQLDFDDNVVWWNFSQFYTRWSTRHCIDGSYTAGGKMCVEWNGSTIDITIEPSCEDMTTSQLANLNNWLDITDPTPGNAVWIWAAGWAPLTVNQWCAITTLTVDTQGGTNIITSIPEEFGLLENLSNVNFNGHSITQLPDSIINMDSLWGIIFNSTALGNLWGSFFNIERIAPNSPDSLQYSCQSNITPTGATVCIGITGWAI